LKDDSPFPLASLFSGLLNKSSFGSNEFLSFYAAKLGPPVFFAGIFTVLSFSRKSSVNVR
jgi:hypothetical protein